MILLHARVQLIDGPRVEFACPRCFCGPTAGISFEQTETLLLFFVIPIDRVRNTYVVCDNCRKKLATRMTLDELWQCSGLDISQFVFHRISFVLKSLSVLSLLLCWFPVVGLILSAITLVGTFNSPGVWRTIAKISLVISLVISVAFAAILLVHIWL